MAFSFPRSGLSRRNFIAGSASLGLWACVKPSAQAEGDKPLPPLGTWSGAPSLPEAVQEIYPCAHNGRLYLAGGLKAKNGRITGAAAAHRSWSPKESGVKAWRAEPALPAPRHHPHMISFQGRLLALAGFESPPDRVQWHIQNTGWMMTQDMTTWERLSPLPAPAAEAVVGVTGDNVLHLAGGRTWARSGQTGAWQDHIDTDHHFVLPSLSGPWERAAPCPYKRNSAAGGVIDGALHIVGGRRVGGGNLAHHTVYDAREDRWRDAAPMPQAQGGLAAASLNGKLYVFGGEYFDNGGGVYRESWVYDPARDDWAALPDMPSPRHGLGAVELGGDIYVIGGALKASGVDTSARVEVFSP